MSAEDTQPADAAREALKPFAAVAEYDVSDSEDDGDIFRPASAYNKAPVITIGDLRRAREAYTALTEPAPAGKAVEPVAWRYWDDVTNRWYLVSHRINAPSDAPIEPLFSHLAHEDTVRLREELERRIAVLEKLYGDASQHAYGQEQLVSALKTQRDDARKALETVANSLDSALSDVRYQPGDHPVVPIKHDTFVGAVRLIASAARSASKENAA